RRIETELGEMELADSIYSPTILSSVRNLTTHARTILRQRRVESDVVTRMSAMPMTQAIDQLSEVFDRDFQAALSETDRYRNYLLAYSSLLLALLVYIGSRLFRSYRIIGRVANRNATARFHRLCDLADRRNALGRSLRRRDCREVCRRVDLRG